MVFKAGEGRKTAAQSLWIQGGGDASRGNVRGLSPTLWLRAKAGITASGGKVSQWADVSSGGSIAFTQTTEANKPTLTVDALGRTVVNFHSGATSGVMTSTATLANIYANNAKTTFWLITLVTRQTSGTAVFWHTSNSRWETRSNATGNVVDVLNYDGSNDIAATGAVSNDTDHILMTLHSGGNLYIQDNESLSAPTASGNTDALTGTLQIGPGSGTLEFNLFDLLTFNKVLTTQEQAVVYNYLVGVRDYGW